VDPSIITFFQVMMCGLLVGGLYALFSVGLNVIFGVMKIINFAHGEFLMLGGYLTYFLFMLANIDPLLSIPITMALLFLVGFLIEKSLIKPLAGGPPYSYILLTLGISIALQNIALILWTGNYRSVPVWYSALPLSIGPISVGLSLVVAFTVAVILTAILYVLLKRTTFGKSVRALSQNPELAQAMGINVSKMYTLTFCLGAMVAGVAGSLVAFTMYIFPSVGFEIAIKSFCIVILGGLGSFGGAIVGALLLGLAESFTSVYLPGGSGWAPVVFFAVLLITLVVKPQGLLGAKA